MFVGNSDAAWERYGKLNPYFGVCTQEKYKSKNLNESALEEFFQSGEEQIKSVFDIVQERVDRNFRPTRALDFGCGVGRLTIPLARVCHSVVGVDASESMLNEARKNCLRNNDVANVYWIRSDDKLSKVSGTFDFVLSLIVFQHIPPPRGEMILKSIVDRLDPGGVGVLHFTYSSRVPRVAFLRAVQWVRRYVPLANNFVNLTVRKKPFFYPLMQWHNYNLNNILLILQEKSCELSYLIFTNHGGHLGVILFFQKKQFEPYSPF